MLATYRHAVSLFRDAVRKGSAALGDDFRLTGAKAQRLAQQCKDANDAFRAHWAQDHDNLGERRNQPD